MRRLSYTVDSLEPVRIDRYLSSVLDCSRSAVVRLISENLITINGRAAAKNDKISINDMINVSLPDPKPAETPAEDIPLEVVFDDNSLLVVNKPKGMVVHPAPGNPDGTLVNALLYHCKRNLSGIGGVLRPGIVHRIDKDTSGLLIVAKNDRSHGHLAAQIKEHSFTRVYEAVVHGIVKSESGTVNAPIGRHPVKRKQMAVTDKNAKSAITHYRVIKTYPIPGASGGGYTHIRLQLETGRTHQIRVHMAYIGHPVAGDVLYGPQKTVHGLTGQCLHAKKIGFIHPDDNRYIEFNSELPDYFTLVLEKLEQKANN